MASHMRDADKVHKDADRKDGTYARDADKRAAEQDRNKTGTKTRDCD